MNSSIPGVSQLTSKRALRPDTTYPIEPPVGMTVTPGAVSSTWSVDEGVPIS